MEKKSQFGTRSGFIFAAVGSAIGLGNIWRFPATAYDNGGGAFFVPYLIALLTTGLGILILEFALGNKYRGSSPLTFSRINKKFESIGWLHVLITFIISTFYSVILAYALRYFVASFTSAWGNDPEGYFFSSILNISEGPTTFGSFVPGIVIPLLIIWAVSLFIVFRGVQNGIEVFNKFMIPVLVVLFSIIVIRAVTLEGASAGLNALFTPNWSSLSDGSVWVAAYGQIFFSLSIAMGVMITYSSYLPKKTELSNSALITGFANSSFELLAGIGVFSALGFMATSLNVPVEEVSAAGIGLAFVVFPQILSTMPASEVFSVLFFGCLVIAGLTSLISILEVTVAGLRDKFKLSRPKAIAIVSIPSILGSLVYTMQNGLFILDTVDYFTNNIAIIVSAILIIGAILYVARMQNEIIEFINAHSRIKIGTYWVVSLKYLTPVLLTYMLVSTIVKVFTEGYEGYPASFLLVFGGGTVVFLTVASLVFARLKWRTNINEPLNVEKENKEVSL